MFSKIDKQSEYIHSLAFIENIEVKGSISQYTISDELLHDLGKESTNLWNQILVALGFVFSSATDKGAEKRKFYIDKGNKIITAVNLLTLSKIFKSEEEKLKHIDSNFKKENKDFANVNQPKDLSRKLSRKEFVRELNQFVNQYQKKAKIVLKELNLSKGKVLKSGTNEFIKAKEIIHKRYFSNGSNELFGDKSDVEKDQVVQSIKNVVPDDDNLALNSSETIFSKEKEVLGFIEEFLGNKTKEIFEKVCERHPLLIRRLALAHHFEQLTKEELIDFVTKVEGISIVDSSFSLPLDLNEGLSVSEISKKIEEHGNEIVSLILYYGLDFYNYVKLIGDCQDQLVRLDDIQEKFENLGKRDEFKRIFGDWFRKNKPSLEILPTLTDLEKNIADFCEENQEIINQSLFVNDSLEYYKKSDISDYDYKNLDDKIYNQKTIAESKQEIIYFYFREIKESYTTEYGLTEEEFNGCLADFLASRNSPALLLVDRLMKDEFIHFLNIKSNNKKIDNLATQFSAISVFKDVLENYLHEKEPAILAGLTNWNHSSIGQKDIREQIGLLIPYLFKRSELKMVDEEIYKKIILSDPVNSETMMNRRAGLRKIDQFSSDKNYSGRDLLLIKELLKESLTIQGVESAASGENEVQLVIEQMMLFAKEADKEGLYTPSVVIKAILSSIRSISINNETVNQKNVLRMFPSEVLKLSQE